MKVVLSLGCGILIGLAAGLNLGAPAAGSDDGELKAELSTLSRRLAELDARLASRPALDDAELILDAVRTALAEREGAASAKLAERAPDARSAPAPTSRQTWTAAESEQARSMLERGGAELSDVLPLARKAVRALDE